ncbi:hypothetical protein ADM96_15680 [Burkholderia sp. ST111]|nr:hypothetical protein ADM96_15680 [Burkholderia sp. ST111]
MAVTAKIIALRAAAADAEDVVAVEPPAPQNTRVYVLHATHPPQMLPLGNVEGQGIVSAINSNACGLILREATGKMLIHIDAPGGFDAPLSIPFAGPLVADVRTGSLIQITISS